MALAASYVVDGLMARGVPRTAAVALAGNSQIESGLDPAINEINPLVKGSRGGFGLMQWTGPRRRQYEAFAGSQGRAVDDAEAQLDFLAWELENTEANAAKAIYAATSVDEAARLVSERFLRPGIPHLEKRVSAALEIDGGGEQVAAADPSAPNFDRLHDAYNSGMMDDQQRAVYERAIQDGQIPKPPSMPKAALAPDGLAEAYLSGNLPPQDIAVFEAALGDGSVALPEKYNRPDVMTPPRADMPAAPVSTATPAPLRADMSEGSFDTAGAALKSFLGNGPSVAAQAIPPELDLGDLGPSIPLPDNVRQGLGRALDGPLAAVSAATGAYEYGAGLLGDGANAIGLDGDSLARDAAGLPEAFIGSPIQRAARFPKIPDAPSGPRPADPERFGRNVNAASRAGDTSKAAQGVARDFGVNPDAVAAADRLGIDVPVDVLSDNTLAKEAAGLTRSLAGTPTSAGWRDTVTAAADKASEAMRSIGGEADLSSVSEQVKGSLRATQTDLKAQADKLYGDIDAKVPRGTRFEPDNTVKALNDVIQDLGGTDGMSAPEKRLFDMVTGENPVTYERLMREKRQIQKALRTGQGPYADADTFMLRRIEAGLVEDQIANVQRVGGDEMAEQLKAANGLVSQRKDLEGQIVNAFGKDGEGSIASKLQAAIKGGASRGDIAGLNRIMNVVPKELQAEAMATAIASVSQSKRATEPGFGFAEYAKTYKGLRANSQVFKKVADTLGPEATAVMRDLFEISNRITDARANVLTTGKANQALLQGLVAEKLIIRVLGNPVTQNTVRAGGAAGGAVFGGGVGAAAGATAGDTLVKALSRNGRNHLVEAGKLFSSPEFQRLAVEAATNGQASQKAINGTVNSRAFRRWAKAAKIQNPEQWLGAALAASQEEEANGDE